MVGTSAGSHQQGSRGKSWAPFLALMLLLGLVLAVLVTLPALGAPPWADQRFYLYEPEKIAGSNPWLLVERAWEEVPGYLDLGTFRPVSRLGFYLEHWVTVRTAILTGLTPVVVQGVVKVLTLALMLSALLVTMDQYRRASRVQAGGQPFRLAVASLVVVAAVSLVLASPSAHPLLLFPLGYLGVTALALFVPIGMGRSLLREGAPGRSRSRRQLPALAGAVVLGAVLAGMIELAYLAVPLALAHLILLDIASGRPWSGLARRLAGSEAGRQWLVLTGGFLAVFVPTRVLIALRCAGRVCYEAVSMSVGWQFLRALPLRALSGFFAAPQVAHASKVLDGAATPAFWVSAAIVAVLVAAVLVIAVARLRTAAGSPGGLPTAMLGAAAGYFATMIVLAALLSALSRAVQDWSLVRLLGSWRDTGFAWAGWTGLLTVLMVVILLAAARRPLAVGLLVAVVALTVAATSVGNQQHVAAALDTGEARLHLQVGELLVDFEATEAGNAERCRVISELEDLASNPSDERTMRLLRTLLDTTARNHYGVPFCASG